MKTCTKCKTAKTLDNFSNDSSKLSGKYSSCKTCAKGRKTYFDSRKELKCKYDQKRYQELKSDILPRVKKYYENNKKNIFEYYRTRSKNDLIFKIKKRIRSRVYKALKGNKKPNSAILELGCSLKDLKKHLESKFKPGMTLDNYGQWHIDHIFPLSKLNLKDSNDFAKACHYTNLQPLWASENLSKGNKI